MPSTTEPRSGIKYGWALGESGWHTEMDANLKSIGRFAYHLAVKDRDLTAPPASPANGDSYIVGPAATGAWAGKDGQVAVWDGAAWVFGVPREGWLATIDDEDVLVRYLGTAWSPGVSLAAIPASTQVSIAMATDANITLTQQQAANDILTLTSAVNLTATRDVVLPLLPRRYTVSNKTSGAQSLRFIGATGTGVIVPNGEPAIIFCDGTNWYQSTSSVAGDAKGPSIVRGLVGANNATTPNTMLDFSADSVTLRSSTEVMKTLSNTGVLTCDIGVAGPAANGRDQSAAFAASTWLHFYFIWNGTTLASIASVTAPPTGPALPSGYTHWAYVGAVYYDATPVLRRTRLRGAAAYYDSRLLMLGNGTATAETAVNMAGAYPPNALTAALQGGSGNFADAAGDLDITQVVQVVSGSNFWVGISRGKGFSANAEIIFPPTELNVPNVGQQVFYKNINTLGTGRLDIFCIGYKIPNGGE